MLYNAVALTFATLASMLYAPTIAFAEKDCEVAIPEAFVTAVFTPPVKTAEAPLLGTVNVTVIPGTGRSCASFTRTDSGDPKSVETTVSCPEPPFTVRLLGV